MPNNECSSIEQQRYIFGIRNRMISLPVYFPQDKMEIVALLTAQGVVKMLYGLDI